MLSDFAWGATTSLLAQVAKSWEFDADAAGASEAVASCGPHFRALKPFLVVPALSPAMRKHPVVVKQWRELSEWGVVFVERSEGEAPPAAAASAMTADVNDIVQHVRQEIDADSKVNGYLDDPNQPKRPRRR